MNYPFAANKKKNPFNWWQMLFFVLLVIGFLIFLFPKKLFNETFLRNTKPSAVSISYLKNLVEKNPDDVNLRMNLAQQQFTVGQVKDAKKTISPLVKLNPSSQFQWEVLWLYYQIVSVETFQLKEKTVARKEKETLLKTMQISLTNSPYLTLEQQEQLAGNALAFEQPYLANQLYKKITLRGGKKSAAFYANAGKAALYVKDYQSSAEFYRLAMDVSSTLEEKRRYYINALDSLSASGSDSKTLEFAKKNLDGLSKDENTLFYLTKLALRVGQQKAAEFYANQLLQLDYRDSAK
jgi:hypothetical protein